MSFNLPVNKRNPLSSSVDHRTVYATPFLEWAGRLPLGQASKREARVRRMAPRAPAHATGRPGRQPRARRRPGGMNSAMRAPPGAGAAARSSGAALSTARSALP